MTLLCEAGVEEHAPRPARVWAMARAIVLIASTALAFAVAWPNSAAAHHVGAYAIIDAETGDLLQGSRATKRVHPASLTKMMTLYLAFEALEQRKLSFERQLRTSAHAEKQPRSDLGLRTGERISVRDAIRAAAVSSANDAAVVLAEAIGGTEAAFARMMTRKARALGMGSTTFKNASGLTAAGHLSTASDMAILARALWRDFPQHYAVFSRKRITVKGRSRRATNTLLGVSPGVDGIKTGYTRAAGHNLAASAVRQGRRVIVVYMGGRSRPLRDRTVRRLLDVGFSQLRNNRAPRLGPVPRRRPDAEPAIGFALAAPPRLRADARPTRAPAMATSSTRPRAPARSSAGRDGRWAVQVGAFRAERAATAHLSRLIRLDAPGITSGFRSVLVKRDAARVSSASPIYRARFTGLSERDARAACRYLKRQSEPCALVPPGGWEPG